MHLNTQYPPVLVLDVPTKSFENRTPRSLPSPYLRVTTPYKNSYRVDKKPDRVEAAT